VSYCHQFSSILAGGLKCRTQFWKGTTKGSFQQSLVEIGSVVSEVKIFFKFHPPFFLFLAWRPSWLEVGITGHIFQGGPPKDHSIKVWLQLDLWFLRRRLKCEMLTDGRCSLANEVAKGYSNSTVRPSHPCEHSRINILQWILTKLGTYLVLKKIWNPIDFQGHSSRVKVTRSNFYRITSL
jgi:hypothetical protein